MTRKKIKVPDGMFEEAHAANCYYRGGPLADRRQTEEILTAALRWLSENPIVPDELQSLSIKWEKERFPFDPWEWIRWGACEWQRRMFLAPDEDDPIKNLMAESHAHMTISSDFFNDRIREAYKRGRASK